MWWSLSWDTSDATYLNIAFFPKMVESRAANGVYLVYDKNPSSVGVTGAIFEHFSLEK